MIAAVFILQGYLDYLFPSEGITGKLNKGILYGKNNICNR